MSDAHKPAKSGERTYEKKMRVWRGDASGGSLQDYSVEVNPGEVVLDIIHRLQATQAGEQDPLQLLRERGLVVGDGGQRDADAGRDHRLVRAALRREAHARRGRGHDEATSRVERVVERVEPAAHEGIVERADGQERAARQLQALALLNPAAVPDLYLPQGRIVGLDSDSRVGVSNIERTRP